MLGFQMQAASMVGSLFTSYLSRSLFCGCNKTPEAKRFITTGHEFSSQSQRLGSPSASGEASCCTRMQQRASRRGPSTCASSGPSPSSEKATDATVGPCCMTSLVPIISQGTTPKFHWRWDLKSRFPAHKWSGDTFKPESCFPRLYTMIAYSLSLPPSLVHLVLPSFQPHLRVGEAESGQADCVTAWASFSRCPHLAVCRPLAPAGPAHALIPIIF